MQAQKPDASAGAGEADRSSDSSGEYVEEVVYEEVTDEEEDQEGDEAADGAHQQQQQQQQQKGEVASTQKDTSSSAPAAAAAAAAAKSAAAEPATPAPPAESQPAAAAAAADVESPISSPPPISSHLPLSPNPGDRGATQQQQQQQQPALFSSAGDFDLIGPQVEQQASKVAAEVAEFASQMTHKLQDGLMHAFGSSSSSSSSSGPTNTSASAAPQQQQQQTAADAADGATAAAAAAAAAAAGLGKLTGGLTGISSWWSNLDKTLAANNAPPTAPGGNPAEKLLSSTTPEATLASFFGLGACEAQVESYGCSLQQTYSCATNSITPPMQVVFEGTLHITDRHCCFQANDQQQQQPAATTATNSSSSSSSSSAVRKRPPVAFKICHADVASATREPNPRRSLAASDLLQMVVKPGPDSSSGLAPGQAGFSGRGPAAGPTRGLAPAVHTVAREGLGAAAAAAAAVGSGAAGASGSGSGSSSGGLPWAVVFQDFKPSSGLDGALALIEHLREGSTTS